MKRWEPISFQNGELILLDQRQLPGTVEYFPAKKVEDVIFAISEMVTRGAPAIGITAAYGVYLAAWELKEASDADFLKGMERACEELILSRPTAVNLFWAVHRMKKSLINLQDGSRKEVLAGLLEEAHQINQENSQLNRDLSQYGSTLIESGYSILTHCNTGALATGDYGTALGVIREAVKEGKEIRVYANETRPRLQGARLTAWELMRDEIPVTLLVDSAAAPLIRDGAVDLILVGADCIASNGDVANKIGTFMLSELALKYKVPFYSVAPTTSFDFSISSGCEIVIEEREGTEVTHIEGQSIAPEGVAVFNPAFDVTPGENLTGIITEKGIIRPPFQENISLLRDSLLE